MCDFVGNISVTKNIVNSTKCNDMIIRDSPSGTSISAISNVDNIRRRLQRAMKETGLLSSQDVDSVVEDSLDEEGEEMVDAEKGSIPIQVVNQAKCEEQTFIEKLKVFDVVDRKGASWKQSDQDEMGGHEQGNTRETKCPGPMGCAGVQMDGWLRQ